MDIIVAQGTGAADISNHGHDAAGAHGGDAVAPIPVLAAGGVADGAASQRPWAPTASCSARASWRPMKRRSRRAKQAILDSDSHDTLVTDIPDVASGNTGPALRARAAQPVHREWMGRQRVTAGGGVKRPAPRAARAGDPDRGAVA